MNVKVTKGFLSDKILTVKPAYVPYVTHNSTRISVNELVPVDEEAQNHLKYVEEIKNISAPFDIKAEGDKYYGFYKDRAIVSYLGYNSTGNCQIMNISNFNILLNTFEKSNIPDDKILHVLQYMLSTKGLFKNMLNVDVHDKWKEKINKVFKVCSHFDYTSTNNSKMSNFLIDIRNF